MKKNITILTIIITFSISSNAQWTTLNSGSAITMWQTFFASDTLGYLLGYTGDVLKTTDGGQNWTIKTNSDCGALYFLSPDTGFGVQGNNNTDGLGLYKTTDGASTWTNIIANTDYLTSITFIENGHLGYIAGICATYDSLVIYKTVDRGSNWQRFAVAQIQYLLAPSVFFLDSLNGYIVDQLMGIYCTTDGGFTWKNQYYDSTGSYFVDCIYFPSKDTGYAGGQLILKTTDGGQQWTVVSQSVINGTIASIWFDSSKRGFMADGGGAIIETSDGGQTWKLDVNTTLPFWSLSFPSSNVGYASGNDGELLKYNVPLGIWESERKNAINIYPNPSSSELNFEVYAYNKLTECELRIYDSSLKETEKRNLSFYNGKFSLDIRNYSNGIYFYQLENENENQTFQIGKFVVNK